MIKKNYLIKDRISITNELINAYDTMLSNQRKNHSQLIKIDLTNTNSNEEKKYNFELRVMLDNLRKSIIKNNQSLNYIYVIELAEEISKGINLTTNKIKYHSHLILETNLNTNEIINSIKSKFKTVKSFSFVKNQNADCYIEDITNRNDKENYINYLLKQRDINNYSYNFKIS